MLRPMPAFLLILAVASSAAPAHFEAVGTPELAFPGVVATNHDEVKLTLSPDGTRLLWGTIDWEGGAGKWDIWESTLHEGQWSKPTPVSFNSPEKDFDPSFAPD